MRSKKAMEFISIICTENISSNRNIFVKAVELAEEEMRERAIEAYIQCCEYKFDWFCGVREVQGVILTEPDVCEGQNCPYVKSFIELIDNK